jgi:hypothetical protein
VVRAIAVFLMIWALILSPFFLTDDIIRFGCVLFVALGSVMTFGGLGVMCYFLCRSSAEQTFETSNSFVPRDSHVAFDLISLLHEC